jgi:hypothetical protein
MKSTSLNAILAAFFTLGSLSQPAHAETKATCTQMDVPFAFDYGSVHLVPGVYTIDLRNTNLLILRSAKVSAMAMTRTEENRLPVSKGHATFTRYGDRFFLDELWIAGDSAHLHVYHAKPKQSEGLASHAATVAQVDVALLSVPAVSGK